MTQDEIIQMAREADREWDCDRDMYEWLEWFAGLVAKKERERISSLIAEMPGDTAASIAIWIKEQ